MEWWLRKLHEQRSVDSINDRALVAPVEVVIEHWHDPQQGTTWYTARSDAFLPHGWGRTADQAIDDLIDSVERHYRDLLDLAELLNLPDLPDLVELRSRFANGAWEPADDQP